MKIKLFSYNQLDTFIHKLSGSTKLLCFLILTSAVMFTYDYRVIFGVLVFAFALICFAKIPFKKLTPLFAYVTAFLVLNFILTLVIVPKYGEQVYGTKHVVAMLGSFEITAEQLIYQCTKTLKYFSAIPLGVIFFLTTNPSEFASSVNRVGAPYKACTALSLTLRYFPDLQNDFNDVSYAQQARGMDSSKKASLKNRIVNTTKIVIPLIFSTLDRIEAITNAMELRGYGKNKKRTWYSAKALQSADFISIVVSVIVLAISLYMRFAVVGSMYYNPYL